MACSNRSLRILHAQPAARRCLTAYRHWQSRPAAAGISDPVAQRGPAVFLRIGHIPIGHITRATNNGSSVYRCVQLDTVKGDLPNKSSGNTRCMDGDESTEEACCKDKRTSSSDYDECDIIREYSQLIAAVAENSRRTGDPEILILSNKNTQEDYLSTDGNELEDSPADHPAICEGASEGVCISTQPQRSGGSSGEEASSEASPAMQEQAGAGGPQPAPLVNVKYHTVNESALGQIEVPAGQSAVDRKALLKSGMGENRIASVENEATGSGPEDPQVSTQAGGLHEGSPTTESTERDPILDAGALEPANASSEVELCGSAVQVASGEVQAPPSAPLLDAGRAQGKMLARRGIALQREALSDVDDVSTDSEFIKVNVIDARDVAYRVPGGKSAKPEPQRGKLRPVGVKIKVNRHVIESSRTPTSVSSFSSAIMQAGQAPCQEGTDKPCVPILDAAAQPPEQLALASAGDAPAPDGGEVIEQSGDALEIMYNEQFTSMDAMDLLTEMKRHISMESPTSGQRPVNRFVIGHKQPMININDIIEIDDFRRRDLYDRVQRRTTRGCFNHCWVHVTNGMLICYRSKAAKDSFPQGHTSDLFQDPVEGGCFYERKFTIDLSISKLYLGHEKPSWCNCGICCRSIPLVVGQLTDITNVKIRRIRQQGKSYVIEMSHSEGASTVTLSNLDFVFEHCNEFYYFRVSSIDTFLKWVLTYHLRRERGIRRIEKLVD